MHKSKRAEGGGNVAVILVVIAIFMVLYLLFVSPEERQRILQSDNSSDLQGSNTGTIKGLELLAESPGEVNPTKEFAAVHRMSSVNIFLKEEPVIKDLASSIQVVKSLFSSTTPKLRFRTESLTETKRVYLFFSNSQASGELRIKINGNTIYGEEIKTAGISLVEIPLLYLKRDNEIELSVSSPGIAFWQTNKYDLKNIGIKQEFERKNVEETRTFTLTDKEASSLKSLKLKYTQQCNTQLANGVTRFEIFINDERAHSADIRCITTEEEIDLDPTLVKKGANTMTFRLEKGDFSFHLLKIETQSSESQRPTYFFSISENQFSDIKAGTRSIKLKMLLNRIGVLKNARILINNHEILLQTDKSSFERNLKDYIIEGTNFIRIVPISSFNIVGLKVTVE